MTARMSLVTLKQYRVELGVALLAALGAAAIGLVIHLRLDALGVTQECLDQVRASRDGANLQPDCARLAGSGAAILGEMYLNPGGIAQASVMGLLPFVVGLLAGLPIVARELEDRTAQTAWSLNPSRSRWLLKQLVPVGLTAGVAMIAAAAIASIVADDWLRWYGPEASRLVGTHGPLLVARAFGAFGIGLATGAWLGRTFPAFLASVALLFLLLVGALQVRDAYLAQLPLQPLWQPSAATGQWESIGGVPQAVAWGGPSGEVLTVAEARQMATSAGVPPAGPNQSYDTAAESWLNRHGYVEISLGTTDAAAAGWALYDGILFAVVGGGCMATAFAIVSRRRPL